MRHSQGIGVVVDVVELGGIGPTTFRLVDTEVDLSRHGAYAPVARVEPLVTFGDAG